MFDDVQLFSFGCKAASRRSAVLHLQSIKWNLLQIPWKKRLSHISFEERWGTRELLPSTMSPCVNFSNSTGSPSANGLRHLEAMRFQASPFYLYVLVGLVGVKSICTK